MKCFLIILLSFVLVVCSCHPSGLHSKPFKPITSTPTTSAPAALSTTPKPQTPVTEAPITTTTITTTTTTTESSPESDCDPSAICDFEAIDPMLESPYGFIIKETAANNDGCLQKKIECSYLTSGKCSTKPEIVAVNTDGEFTLATDTSFNTASWIITCRKDGKLSTSNSGTELFGVTAIKCDFTGC